MKKSLSIIALAALAFVGCSKITADAPINKTEDKGQEINFQVATYMGQTKAENTTYPNNVSFGTYAWYNGTGTPTPAPAKFMENQQISYQTGVWKAKGQTYYWPKTGNIDFISYSPYDSTTPWLNVTANTLTASTTGVAANDDYLYSDKALAQTQNTNPGAYYTAGVPTLFHHALCKVCVKIKVAKTKNADEDVEWVVNLEDGAQIINYAKSGSLVLELNTDGTWRLPANNVWTASECNQTLNCTKQPLPYTLTTTATDILAETTVMPQSLTSQALALTIEITTKNLNANTQITEKYDTIIDLATKMGSSAPKHWQMNKKITYTVTVDPEGAQIYFDPAVADWDAASGDHTYAPEQ